MSPPCRAARSATPGGCRSTGPAASPSPTATGAWFGPHPSRRWKRPQGGWSMPTSTEPNGTLLSLDVESEVDGGDVVVVGAGAAGLLSAIELRCRGLDVTVLDAEAVAAAQSG